MGPGHLGLAFQLLSALGFVERNEQNVSGQLERWQGGSLPGSADAGSRGRGPGSLELLPEPVPKWPQPRFPKSWLQNGPARGGIWGEAPGSLGPSATVNLQ